MSRTERDFRQVASLSAREPFPLPSVTDSRWTLFSYV